MIYKVKIKDIIAVKEIHLSFALLHLRPTSRGLDIGRNIVRCV